MFDLIAKQLHQGFDLRARESRGPIRHADVEMVSEGRRRKHDRHIGPCRDAAMVVQNHVAILVHPRVADEDLSNTMGAFLGYFLVRSTPDATIGLDEAARQIAARTRPIKAHRHYLDSLINMQFINTVWPRLSATARRHFMRKSLPMSGGISNVVVRDAWMNENRDVILDYHRGASTGPSLPIVLSPTTFGDHLNIGVSYRVAGFTRAKIDALMERFRDQIEHPNKASRGSLRRWPVVWPAMEPVGPTLQQPSTPTTQS